MTRHQARALIDVREQESFVAPAPPDAPVVVVGPILAPVRSADTVPVSPDPRPDLTDDSALWCDLLARAFAVDGSDPRGLFGALHGLRCQGARLAVMPAGGARLVCEDEGYPDWRGRWLAPHRANLLALLAAVRV